MIRPPKKLAKNLTNWRSHHYALYVFLYIKKSFSVFKHLGRGYLAKLSYKN